GLSIPTQIVVVILCIITAVGAAGVPGGSIPLMAMILTTVGVPAEGIALILGVDRILDMSRTVPNVMGDQLTSLVVARRDDVELHLLALGQGLEALALDGAVVDEAVLLAVGRGDEPKALGVVEPLHGAGSTHSELLMLRCSLESGESGPRRYVAVPRCPRVG